MGHPPPAALIDPSGALRVSAKRSLGLDSARPSLPATKRWLAIDFTFPSGRLRAAAKPSLGLDFARLSTLRASANLLLAIVLLACSTEQRAKQTAVEARTDAATKPAVGTDATKPVALEARPDAATADCAGRVRAIRAGDLSAGGLPPGCRLSAIESALGARGDTGSGSLSFHVRPWRSFDKGNVRVWLESETDDSVLRIDIGGLATTETGPSLEAKLGKPAQQIRSETNPGTRDWIYPDRGLTLSILGSSSDPRLRAVAIYAPTTLAEYNDRLGGTAEPVRRVP